MSDRERAPNELFEIERTRDADVLRLISADSTNRLTRACVLALTEKIRSLAHDTRPLILAGNRKFFSVGADLNEIASLTGPAAYEFSQMGHALMNAVSAHSPFAIAAIEGHCMGGGLDLVLACHRRVAAPSAVFGHRGAALGLITGWGGTQRLPRLIGKGRALEMFAAAERVSAQRAFAIGLVDAIAEDPVVEAMRWISARETHS